MLEDRRVTLPACERSAIAAGNVDRRVLAALEVLVAARHRPVRQRRLVLARRAHAPRRARRCCKTGNAIALTSLDGRAASGAVAAASRPARSRALHGAARPAISTTHRPRPGS